MIEDGEIATILLLTATVFVVIAATIILTLWFAGPQRRNPPRPRGPL